MIPLTLAEVAAACDGTLHDVPDPGAVLTGTVEFDSRRVTPSGLFVALSGERVDGHTFAPAAVWAGALAVLAERPLDLPAVVVPPECGGPVGGLARLAGAVIARLPRLTVVGVTGSSGKTTTKDLLAQLLARLGPTVAPPESFNNEIGHPYTALKSTAATRYLVLEKSARGVGHIAALCRSVPPRIGVVLNVGLAHVGEFGSREAIATAKGELVAALPSAEDGGVAVLNADDPLVAAMAGRTQARVVTTGMSEQADVRATDVSVDPLGRASYTLVTPAGNARVRLGLHGEHLVPNSLAAAAVALELGLSPLAVAQALTAARSLSRRRMDVRQRADGLTVINDSYNANPDSTAAGLHTLATIARGRRSWAVLGLMAELGDESAVHHRDIGALAARLGVDRLVVVGEDAAPVGDGASGQDGWAGTLTRVPDVAAATDLLMAEAGANDVVLVKASKVAALWRVAEALLDPSPNVGEPA